MHIVVIDPQTAVPTHIFFCHNDSSKKKKKALKLKNEIISARALGEELTISRSLFALLTPAIYEILVIKDDGVDNNTYGYKRARVLMKTSEWLMHDRAIFSFDAAVIAVDSEDLTLTITVQPSSRVLIEEANGYEELKLNEEITKLFP